MCCISPFYHQKKYSATVEFVFIVSPWREGIDYVIV
jgi:hypothetical protein